MAFCYEHRMCVSTFLAINIYSTMLHSILQWQHFLQPVSFYHSNPNNIPWDYNISITVQDIWHYMCITSTLIYQITNYFQIKNAASAAFYFLNHIQASLFGVSVFFPFFQNSLNSIFLWHWLFAFLWPTICYNITIHIVLWFRQTAAMLMVWYQLFCKYHQRLS